MKPSSSWRIIGGDWPGATLAVITLALAGCRDAEAPRAANRDATRAYYGAPPVIPHSVRELGRANCLACHDQGLKPADGEPAAVAKPHATLGDCRQCHVEQPGGTDRFVGNSFIGLAEPRTHHAAYTGAPPTIPHRVWLRENCLACHGPRGHAALQTSHPERTNCTQCHVPQEPESHPFVDNQFAAVATKS